MPRVCLISEALRSQGDDPIEDSDLLRSRTAFSNAPTDLELKTFSQLGFIPIQIEVTPQTGEVIAMNHQTHIPRRVMKYTWIRGSGNKTNTLEDLGISVLPEFSCVARAVDASDLFGY